MFGDLYSMEADNDEIELDVSETTNDETAVTEAGTDTEATDVSNIDTKTEAHNELASTGGVATGSDTSDMEMDPVAATESFVNRTFGLSVEDVEETIEENVAVADSIPNADATADDAEAAAVGMTPVDGIGGDTGAASDATVSTSNAIVEITDPATQIEGDGEDATPDVESASDVAALESLRRTLSREDVEDTSASGGADVELDVKTNENDLNIQMDGKSTTLTPNEDGGEAPAEDTGAAEGGEEPPAEGGEEAPAEGGEEEAGAEGGEGGEEEAAESWNYFL
jgi:hypothetical protein